MRLLVTGATGFVGSFACPVLFKRGMKIRAVSRKPLDMPFGIEQFITPSLSLLHHGCSVFDSVDCVLHLAGRAHVLRESALNPLEAYREVNVRDTLKFAFEASKAGVRRFVFVSTIKVNGELTSNSSPFCEDDVINTVDPYAKSKHEAELALLELSSKTSMEVVIVRPPLIYGPGVKGNFKILLELLERKIPLPLAMATTNRRSLISVDNLVDFLALCITHPNATGRLFLISDQQDLSTADLLIKLGVASGSSARLFPLPLFFLKWLSKVFGKSYLYDRLCSSLVVDSSLASKLLGWSPPLSLDEGLNRYFKN